MATKVVLTGGGTAGHVMPHLALLPLFEQAGWQPVYIGSRGIEKSIISHYSIPFYEIQVGKLRRYLSFENLLDVFRLVMGVVQAIFLIGRLRPHLVFSKGGFVSVPVAVAAWLWRVPVVTHESDLTPGLANRIISRFSKQLLYSFPETEAYLPKERSHWVGLPVRPGLLTGDRDRGLVFCGFEVSDQAPVLLVMGGSLGAQRINENLEPILGDLVEHFRIIHLTGRGKGIDFEHSRYRSFEFVNEEMADLLAAADGVVCRAGANSIFELLRLRKPMLLIPLEIASRGDQVHNADCFAKHGFAHVLREKDMTASSLKAAIERLFAAASELREQQDRHSFGDQSEQLIFQQLSRQLKGGR
jgi:UDP-N-acetylglucosamine--N-acetylmuramyl-(pentapeptide) pyrophosphoryl-undecaprenol N-acetylglucosamine transferase